MTITPAPEQERILAEAIQAGLIENAEAALDVGLETLRSWLPVGRESETPRNGFLELDHARCGRSAVLPGARQQRRIGLAKLVVKESQFARVQASYEAGTYNVSPSQIANSILNDTMLR